MNFVGHSKGNRSLGRPRRRWQGNIKMSPKEICFVGVCCFNLIQECLTAWCSEHGKEVSCCMKRGIFLLCRGDLWFLKVGI
jgi:hypothetical protein